jgi:hypothetical protein
MKTGENGTSQASLRERLIDYILRARSRKEISAAEAPADRWMRTHPDDWGVASAGEQPQMMKWAQAEQPSRGPEYYEERLRLIKQIRKAISPDEMEAALQAAQMWYEASGEEDSGITAAINQLSERAERMTLALEVEEEEAQRAAEHEEKRRQLIEQIRNARINGPSGTWIGEARLAVERWMTSNPGDDIVRSESKRLDKLTVASRRRLWGGRSELVGGPDYWHGYANDANKNGLLWVHDRWFDPLTELEEARQHDLEVSYRRAVRQCARGRISRTQQRVFSTGP